MPIPENSLSGAALRQVSDENDLELVGRVRSLKARSTSPLWSACFCVVLVLGAWENGPNIALEPSLGLLFMPGGPKRKSSMKRLFTERHGGMTPRVSEELDERCRVGLLGTYRGTNQ